jgi:CubicO group peptidase (beta-lactamase class C family)
MSRFEGPNSAAVRRADFIGARSFLTLATAFVLAAGDLAAQKPTGFENAWRDLAGWYHETLGGQGMVGSALWYFANGETVAREFHGFADLASQRKVDERTIFHWASITKTFTGIAIMQLRDRGRLELDDPLVKYLPELRAVRDTFGPIDAITIRHAMAHTGGFRAGTWPWGGSEPWHPHEPTDWSQIVAMLPYTEILFAPGSRSSYSNPAIVFLGRIIEILSGDDFEVYVDKNILKPLGMHESYFDVTPYHLLENRSNNYLVRDGKAEPQGLDFDTGITTSNSGLNAPITDMARYLAFLTGSALSGPATHVLARASLDEMWTTQIGLTPDTARGRTRESMGLIFFLFDHDGRRFVGHTGSQKAFQSFFYIDPAAGTAAIAAFNTDPAGTPRRPDTRAILTELRTRLFDSIFPLWPERRRTSSN